MKPIYYGYFIAVFWVATVFSLAKWFSSSSNTRPILFPDTTQQSSEIQQLNYPTSKTSYAPITSDHPSPVDHLWTSFAKNTQAWRTAYFDNRTSTFGGPTVITIVIHNHNHGPMPKIYCKYSYSNGSEVYQKSPAGTIQYSRYNKGPDRLNLVHCVLCKLPTNEIPHCVFLSRYPSLKTSSAYIPLYYSKPKKKVKFAVCLMQALYNEPDPERIAAWIEMNKALGAELITLYYQESPDNVVDVVQKYVDEGLVEALDWKLNITRLVIHANGQDGVINDCFYRTFHRAEYIAFIDIDEFLVPHRHSNWHELMNEIDNNENKIGQFSFCQSHWHDVGEQLPGSKPPLKKRCLNFTKVPLMFRRTQRTKNFKCSYRPKNMIKPIGIMTPRIHITSLAKGYQKYKVPTELGLLHHYRIDDITSDEEKVEDLVMNKFVGKVMNGLKEKLCS